MRDRARGFGGLLQVTLRITPAIRGVLEALRPKGTVRSMYVIRTIDNQPYSASGLRTAWSRACERAGLKGMTLKDLRAKAATDARLAGYQPEQIPVALANTDHSMTQHYILGRDAPLSEVQLKLPERPKEGGEANESG